jgi:hypothetical protein
VNQTQTDRPKAVQLRFIIFASILVLAVISPSFVPGTSSRLDILLLPFALCLIISTGVQAPLHKGVWLLFFGFLLQTLSAFLPIALQNILLGEVFSSAELMFIFGNTRSGMMFLLAALCIRTSQQAIQTAIILTVSAAIHGVIAFIEYNRIAPLDTALLTLFNSTNFRVGTRAVGVFPTVHSLAFFGLYTMGLAIALLCIMRSKIWAVVGLIGAGLCVVLPFSRAANLGLLILLFCLLVHSGRALRVALFSTVIVFGGLIFPFLPIRIRESFSSLVGLIDFLSGRSSTVDTGYISGRIEFGWKNALDLWLENPILGSGVERIDLFVGDGFYTSHLCYVGILGLGLWAIGYLIQLNWFMNVRSSDTSIQCRVPRGVGIGTLLAAGAAAFATGYIQYRTIEIFPVIIFLLAHWARPQMMTDLPSGIGKR